MAIKIEQIPGDQEAWIEQDTELFRLTAKGYSSPPFLLNGKGADVQPGRYHFIQQPTSYVANNILVCMAESLYHMSRRAMEVLRNNGPPAQWLASVYAEKHLVVFSVNHIPDLIYIDAADCRKYLKIQEWLASTTVVNPDQFYEPIQKAANFLRANKKNGVVYPSARHSRDFAVALVGDKNPFFAKEHARLRVELMLGEEKGKILANSPSFNRDTHKISHVYGYYRFRGSDFAQRKKHLYPLLRKPEGWIEYVRRPYKKYPDDALLSP